MMTCHVEKRDKYYLLASRGITGFLLAGPAIVALWHFFGTGSGPFVNDMLLHQLEVNRIASIFSAAEEFPAKSASHNLGSFVQSLNVMHAWLEKWTWALVCACDHVLGGHGLGFPLLHHYQHLPHLVVGFAGAILEDPDFAFRGATALMVGVGLPATLFVAHLSLGSHPLTAAFATALLPVLNDAPPSGQMQQGYQYNYGLGWGASMHGGHGLWTQPFATAALIAAITTACHALTARMIPSYQAESSTSTETSVNSSSSNSDDTFSTSQRLRIRSTRLASWRGIVSDAAWVGAWIACAGLCNVLYGYMAGVAVGAAAGVATIDAAWLCFKRWRKSRFPSSSSSSQQEMPTPPSSSLPLESPSQQQPVAIVAGSKEGVTEGLFVGAVVLLVAGVVGGLLSGYFIGPHMWRREALSNYEARDYKLEGEGLRAALLLFTQGNLFDFGWQLPVAIDTVSAEVPKHMQRAISVLHTVASAMPRFPVITLLVVGGAVAALSLPEPLLPAVESAITPLWSPPLDQNKEQINEQLQLPEEQRQQKLRIQNQRERRKQCQRAKAGWLAARTAVLLGVVFLVLYAGYGGPPGGGWALDLTTKGNQRSRTAAQRQQRRFQNKNVGHRSGSSSRSDSAKPMSALVELAMRWMLPVLACLSSMLAQGVQALPLVKSLHLHRFLGGCHLTALLLAPCAVEAMARGLDTVVDVSAVSKGSAQGIKDGEKDFVTGREKIRENESNESADKDVTAAEKRKMPSFDVASTPKDGRDESSRMYPPRINDRARCAVVMVLVLLLLPAAAQRGLWVLVDEPRARAARHAAATRVMPHIDTLMATLRALPPGRVWAGDRSSAASFAKSRDESNGHDIDVSSDDADDLLFVHLLQRGMGCGSSSANFHGNNSVSSGRRGMWGGAPCGRTIDVVGSLLHGLSTAADLLPEVDVLQSPQQRRAFAIAYVALPRKWLEPVGKAPLPSGMVEVPLLANCYHQESQSSTAESNQVCRSRDTSEEEESEVNTAARSVCEENQGQVPQSPYRLFADPQLVPSSPHSPPTSFDLSRKISSSAAYFGLARVLAFPSAHEHVFTPSDAYSLSGRTAAHLKPVTSAAAASFYEDVPSFLQNKTTSNPGATMGAAKAATATTAAAATAPGLDRPTSAAAVRHIAQGWLMGLATQLTSTEEDSTAAPAPAGDFYLAWPPRTAFDLGAASAGSSQEGEASLWRHGGGNEMPRWESGDTRIGGYITHELVSSNLDRFECNVTVFASSGLATDHASGVAMDDAQEENRRNLSIPAASLVLKASYHPGWRCAVAPRMNDAHPPDSIGAYQDVVVGEVLPGFLFIDLPVGNHSVCCSYLPAPHKGRLLAVAGFTMAFLFGTLALPAVLGSGF